MFISIYFGLKLKKKEFKYKIKRKTSGDYCYLKILLYVEIYEI